MSLFAWLFSADESICKPNGNHAMISDIRRLNAAKLLTAPEGEQEMKIGVIRCAQTEDYCPGTTDFKVVRERKGAFEGVEEEIEIVGFTNCGGCPGKKAVLRARELVKHGADTIVFASCIQKGNPIGYPCPFAKKMREIVIKDLPESIRYIDFTH